MEEQNQLIKLCPVSANQREYDNCHRLFESCKTCRTKKIPNIIKKKVILITRSELNQQNVKENRKYQKKWKKHQIEEINKRIDYLTWAMEASKISV